MAEIYRYRVIRPSTRLKSSTNYKVKVEGITRYDVLVVEITHEFQPFRQCFRFNGKDLIGRNNIHFQVIEKPSISIIWKGIKTSSFADDTFNKEIIQTPKQGAQNTDSKSVPLRTSLQPMEDQHIKILILGTMPGEQSLKVQQYYANPSNRFWKIISTILNKNLPDDYNNRALMLLNAGIGLWDVLLTANRKTSLDSDIKKGIPNDLKTFISMHQNLKVIGFNGKTAEKIFDTYFIRKPNYKYLSLPSTSSANTSVNFSKIYEAWKRLL